MVLKITATVFFRTQTVVPLAPHYLEYSLTGPFWITTQPQKFSHPVPVPVPEGSKRGELCLQTVIWERDTVYRPDRWESDVVSTIGQRPRSDSVVSKCRRTKTRYTF
jgi:hypothetical protein